MPSFDKSLLCSEFFTNQNCAVLAIDDNLYVLKLNSKALERLSNLISNSELTGDMVLNIERESGLYLTTEKAIRKAFNKSTRAGSLSRVRDALDPSRTRDSEKFQVNYRRMHHISQQN